MLLAATDMALWVRTVEPLPLITDVVIVYFLIDILRLIVVWMGIRSFLRNRSGCETFVDKSESCTAR